MHNDVEKKLKFGQAVWPFKSGKKPALIVPHIVDGHVVGIRARNLGPSAKETNDRFAQVPGSSIDGLYAGDLLDLAATEVLLFEGCEDTALAISEGFNATGIISAQSKLSAKDIARLNAYQNIYLIGDQDLSGKRAMDLLQSRLDPQRVIRVRLPGVKDIGELWDKEPGADFKKNLRAAMRQAQTSRTHFNLEDLLTDGEIRERQIDSTPYVIDQIFPMNAITMVFGEEKSGKSLLLTYLLKCVANNVKVFGALPVSPRPVLYLDRENSSDEIAGMAEHFAGLGKEPVRYKTRTTNCPEPDDPGLIAFAEKHKPLLVFDSLTKFSKDVDPFKPDEMSALFDKLLNLFAAGATVVIVHHSTKADAQKYANSHQVGANVSRAFWVVSKDRPRLHRVRLETKLSRGAEPANFELIAFPVISQQGCFGLADPGSVKTDEDLVVDWIRIRHPEGCTQETVKKDMKNMRTVRKVAAIKQALESGRLVRKGDRGGILIVPEPGNEWSKPESSPSAGTNGNDYPNSIRSRVPHTIVGTRTKRG